MIYTKNQGFTLVELIVVILILAVLSAVAFVSYAGYGSTSRDSVRLTDLANIEKGFELMKIKSQDFPYPENSIDISSNGGVFQYQGDLSKAILETHLGIHDGGLDPQTHAPYTYVVNDQRNKFQVLLFLENKEVFAQNFNTKTHADNNNKYPQTAGDILGILLDENTLEPIQASQGFSQIDIATTTNSYGLIMNSQIEKGDTTVLAKVANINEFGLKSSCLELLQDNPDLQNQDGIYTLAYKKSEIYDVYCDMTTDGGGWTSVISIADQSHFYRTALSPSTLFGAAATTDEQKTTFTQKATELSNNTFDLQTLGSISTLFTNDTVLESYHKVSSNEIMFKNQRNEYLTYVFKTRSLADYYIDVVYPDDNQFIGVKETNLTTDVNSRGDLTIQTIGVDGDSSFYSKYASVFPGPHFNGSYNDSIDYDEGGHSLFHKKLGGSLNTVSDYVIRYVR